MTENGFEWFCCTERIFEDHENLVENLLNWTRDSQNRLMFTERIEKYALFKNPQVWRQLIQKVNQNFVFVWYRLISNLYLLLSRAQNYLLGRKETCEMAERNKEALLEVGWFYFYSLLTRSRLLQVTHLSHIKCLWHQKPKQVVYVVLFCYCMLTCVSTCVCVYNRSVSAAALSLYQRWRESCG